MSTLLGIPRIGAPLSVPIAVVDVAEPLAGPDVVVVPLAELDVGPLPLPDEAVDDRESTVPPPDAALDVDVESDVDATDSPPVRVPVVLRPVVVDGCVAPLADGLITSPAVNPVVVGVTLASAAMLAAPGVGAAIAYPCCAPTAVFEAGSAPPRRADGLPAPAPPDTAAPPPPPPPDMIDAAPPVRAPPPP
jgi:hypothetical protein